jgi:acyl-coenzyme A thioesterase PaaI-like protein
MMSGKLTMNPSDVLAHWRRFGKLPGGPRVFSRLLGVAAPYSGSIAPRVLSLEPGVARVEMRDRRAVRNHLRCIHAVALMNLAELTGNLALLSALAPDQRMIVTSFRMDFLKKARGDITAEGRAPAIARGVEQQYEMTTELFDPSGTLVARGHVTSKVGPIR